MNLRFSNRYAFNINHLVLGFFLIFFFQITYYQKDIQLLYLSSKIIFPAIAAFIGLFTYLMTARKPIPYANHIVFLFFTLIVISALASIHEFQQSAFLAFTSQWKLIPMFYFFFTIWLFRKLEITPDELEKVLLVMGIGSMLFFFFFHIVYNPQDFRAKDYDFAQFTHGKGHRFRFNIRFGLFAIFILYRKFLNSKKILPIVLTILMLVYLLHYHKQRTLLLAVILVLSVATVEHTNWLKKIPIMIFSIILMAGIILYTPYFDKYLLLANIDDLPSKVRVETLTISLNYLFDGFSNFIFGAGLLNPLGPETYASKFNPMFFTADIGWAGILFEFGAIGGSLFAYWYFIILKSGQSLMTRNKPIVFKALNDFLIFTIFSSIIAPNIMIISGVFATIMGIYVYYTHYAPPDLLNSQIES